MNNKIGMDVSHWQTNMNWDTSKAAGIEFAFIKATEGNSILDAYYARNWYDSKRVGIPRGAYHFYDYRVNPVTQACWLLEKTQLDAGELGYVLDVEELKVKKNGVTVKIKTPITYAQDLKIFCDTVQGENLPIIIYTAYSWWRDHGLEAALWARQCPLWIANYNNVAPIVPLPWGPDSWTFWQFTDRGIGKLYGTDGVTCKQIDLDVWRC
jgi:lysozyme